MKRLKSKPIEELRKQSDVLLDDLNKVYMNAPRTTDRAVARARKALEKNKDNSYTDEEINRMLPNSLRKTK